MMKMKGKYSIVAVALIALLCVGAASALINIWSAPVNVNLQYTVTMRMGSGATEYRSDGMALVARVLDGSNNPVSGITVDFYADAQDGNGYVYVGSGQSNTSGDASFLWTEVGAYNYWFKANCAI